MESDNTYRGATLMSNWTMDDLELWDSRIRPLVTKFGLDCYPQEFEVCDQNSMLGYMAYHGMPAHYPHWSFGKAFEQTKTMYDHGVSGLPYEMVINSDPALAYLMRDNSLALQVLTIAHVYGHNDFFKNNFTFTSATDAKNRVGNVKTSADRVRSYIEDPSIGAQAVEEFLDAIHAVQFNCMRNFAIKKLTREEQRQLIIEQHSQKPDPFASIHKRHIVDESALQTALAQEPLMPELDVLLYIRDHHPDRLADWQKDLLTIGHEEAKYFIPQIDTKIMNEGWASYWHHRLLSALRLPTELQLEFIVKHNQVICPHPGGLNPYHLGFMLWRYIIRCVNALSNGSRKILAVDGKWRAMTEEEIKLFTPRYEASAVWKKRDDWTPEKNAVFAALSPGERAAYTVRETERDVSFLRRFLTELVCRDLDLFTWKPRGEHLVISEVSDEEHWESVKQALLKSIGTETMPVMQITDANYKGRRALHLQHCHDGRDLDMTNTDKTLHHMRTLWGRDTYLLTQIRGKKTLMSVTDAGFDAKLVS